MLKPMAPIDAEVAQNNDLERLKPPRLRCNALAKGFGNEAMNPITKPKQQPQHHAAEEQVLSEEEAQIDEPFAAEESLRRLGRKRGFERTKYDKQEEEARPRGENQRGQIHGWSFDSTVGWVAGCVFAASPYATSRLSMTLPDFELDIRN